MNHTLVIPNLTLFGEDGTAAPDAEDGGLTPELETALDAIAPKKSSALQKQTPDAAGSKQPKTAEAQRAETISQSEPGEEAPPTEPVNKSGEFEKLIKGEYKSEFDRRVQSIIDRRFKEEIAAYKNREKAANPILDKLCMRYGVKDGDLEALAAAVDQDNSYLQHEADESGMDIATLTKIRQMEYQNAQLQRQHAEIERRRAFDERMAGFYRQAEEARTIYPDLDFQTEASNPDFMDLCMKGVPVRTAYEVIHKDEIIGTAMQYSAQKAAKNVTDSIKAKGMRPDENGASGVGAVIKTNVDDLSNQEIDEIIRRVERGEKVTL